MYFVDGISSLGLNMSNEHLFNELAMADYLKAPKQFSLASKHLQGNTCRHLSLCIDDPMENTILVFNQNTNWYTVNAQQNVLQLLVYPYHFIASSLSFVWSLNKIKIINSNRGYKEICKKYLTKSLHMAELAWHNKSVPVSRVTDVCSLPTVTGRWNPRAAAACLQWGEYVCRAQAAARQTGLRWWMDNHCNVVP